MLTVNCLLFINNQHILSHLFFPEVAHILLLCEHVCHTHTGSGTNNFKYSYLIVIIDT